MTDAGWEPIEDAIPANLTESEQADYLRESRFRVVEHKGRLWWQSYQTTYPSGYFQTVHFLARLSAAELGRPTPGCWAYKAALRPEDAGRANGTTSLEIISDLPGYDIYALKPNKRTDVRNALKKARIVHVTRPDLMREQGFRVYRSARQRTGLVHHPGGWNEEQHRARAETETTDRRRFIVAALIGDTLAGFQESFCVDGIAYGQAMYVASEYMRTNVSAAIVFETARAYGRAGATTFVGGPHTPHLEHLTHFKHLMGFRTAHFPARVFILPGIREYIRRSRPATYYSLTGEDPRNVELELS